MNRRLLLAAATVAAVCAAPHAATQAPAAGFGQLTRDNFYQVLEPIARREGRLVLYNSAGNFDTVWKTGLIPRFEARFGVKVEVHNVRRDQANQQLVAVQRTGRPSPVDVYFAGGPDNLEVMRPVLGPWRLADILPNLAAVPAQYKDVVFGIDAQGRWPIVHRSQLALAYDSARLPEAHVPRTFESLLAWAEQHPKKFAFTSPPKGGSGGGFVYSAALHLVTDAACRKTLTDTKLPAARAVAWAAQSACLEPLWTYFRRLLKATELTNGNADTLNLINNRQAIVGTAWEDHALTFVRAKLLPESMRVTSLKPGLIAGGDGIVVPGNTKSPAAALLFVDMAFGREFQAWKLEHHASRSPREDIDPATTVSTATARYLVPPDQATSWSMPANWVMTRALTQALEEKVMSRL